MSGHGVVSLFIEIMNLSELLHQLGKHFVKKYICNNYIKLPMNSFYRYGFATEKHICLGFISSPRLRNMQTGVDIVTTDFIMDSKALYEIDVAGTRFPVKPHIRPLPIPALNSELNKKYIPTPVVTYESDVFR